MKKKLKVCVISCGMIADSAHIPAYRCLSDDYDIVAVCDVNEKAAEAASRKYEIPFFYTDAETMLEKHRPDVVSVCVPNMLHKQYTMLALNYNANVICEKPVALKVSDALEMYALAAQKGKLLSACQSWRFMPERIAAKKFIDSGGLGEVYYGEFSRIRRRGIPTWGKFHIKEASGGGAFLDIGVHVLDAAIWLMGNPEPEAVLMRSSRVHTDELGSLRGSGDLAGNKKINPLFNPDEMNVESFSCGTVHFKNGASLNFKAAWAANLREENNIILSGEKSGIDVAAGKILYGETGSDMLPIPLNRFPEEPFYGHFYLIENFAGAVRDEQALAVSPQESINVSSIIEAAYRSAETEHEVKISELSVKSNTNQSV